MRICALLSTDKPSVKHIADSSFCDKETCLLKGRGKVGDGKLLIFIFAMKRIVEQKKT